MKYLVSLSGGKDSTACLIWALKTFNKKDVVAYYIDTKWEHEDVYTYLDYLEKKFDIVIIRLSSEGMVELSKRKKTMPNRTMRFCTDELKIKPSREFLLNNYILKDIDFINIVGIRRDESKTRENTESFSIQTLTKDKIKYEIKTLCPIAYWDTQKVFDYHKENKVEVNPLYKRGNKRVGCYPCVFASKYEIQTMKFKLWSHFTKID